MNKIKAFKKAIEEMEDEKETLEYCIIALKGQLSLEKTMGGKEDAKN